MELFPKMINAIQQPITANATVDAWVGSMVFLLHHLHQLVIQWQ
jgi:hypothetical protein